MRFVHSLFKWFSSVIFHASLFALIGAICFSVFFGSSQKIKNSIAESGIYNEFVDSVIKSNLANGNTDNSSIPFNDTKVQEIAKSIFTPALLQNQTDKLIDGGYSWLDGSETKLKFSVDLSKQRLQLIDSLSTYAAERLNGLRPCSLDELKNPNVFTLQCQPPGFYQELVKNQVSNDLSNSDFLKDANYNESSLPLTKDGKTIDQKYSFAPVIFKILKNGIWVFGGLFLITASLYVVARLPLRKGIKAFGKDMLTNGIMLIIFTIFYSLFLPKITSSFNLQSGGSGAEAFTNVSKYFTSRLDTLIINISIQIATVGLIVLIAERMSRPSSLYSSLAKKTGISSSVVQNHNSSSTISKRPPIQTSEPTKTVYNRKKSEKRRITL